MKSLTPKQNRFCEEYVVDFNGTQSVIRAGYSKKTAKEQASRLLTFANIQAKIKELTEAQSKRTEIRADQVMKELALIGFSNMLDYVEIENGVAYTDLSKLTREQAAAIQEIVTEEGEAGRRVKIKLTDKIRALTKMGEHLGMFIERSEVGKPGEFSGNMPEDQALKTINDLKGKTGA